MFSSHFDEDLLQLEIDTWYDYTLVETISKRVVRDQLEQTLAEKKLPASRLEISAPLDENTVNTELTNYYSSKLSKPRIETLLKQISKDAGLSEADADAIKNGLFSPNIPTDQIKAFSKALSEISNLSAISQYDLYFDISTSELRFKKKGGWLARNQSMFETSIPLRDYEARGGISYIEQLLQK